MLTPSRNDGSTDRTPHVVEEHARTDARIATTRTSRRQGRVPRNPDGRIVHRYWVASGASFGAQPA